MLVECDPQDLGGFWVYGYHAVDGAPETRTSHRECIPANGYAILLITHVHILPLHLNAFDSCIKYLY